MSETAHTLRAAADHIERVGWLQYRSFATGPEDWKASPCCVVGALTVVGLGDDYAANLACDALSAWLSAHGEPSGFVIGWNDRSDQTAENVIATLRQAADDLDMSSK